MITTCTVSRNKAEHSFLSTQYLRTHIDTHTRTSGGHKVTLWNPNESKGVGGTRMNNNHCPYGGGCVCMCVFMWVCVCVQGEVSTSPSAVKTNSQPFCGPTPPLRNGIHQIAANWIMWQRTGRRGDRCSRAFTTKPPQSLLTCARAHTQPHAFLLTPIWSDRGPEADF